MNKRCLVIMVVLVLCCVTLHAENIDPYEDGSQYAYGENVGWMSFEPDTGDGVQACVVTMDDLQNFASYWLDSGAVAGNLDNTGNVNNVDFAIFPDYWQDLCPAGWQLK